MSQKENRQKQSEPEPGRIATREDLIASPAPSLTPEQRHDWAYDRLMEAYRCMNCDKRRALLLSIVKNPVEDKQLMSAVYATLSSAELDFGAEHLTGLNNDSISEAMKACGVRAEQYALKALELKPTNTAAPHGLFCALILQKRSSEAFEVIAKYNIDLAILPGTEYLPRKERMAAYHSGDFFHNMAHQCLERECQDPEKFERYFDIHIRYRESFHYTALLLMAVFYILEVSNSAKSVLCDDLIRFETVEKVGAAFHFVTLTDLLHCYHFMEDKPALKKCLAELDALRPSCWNEVSEITRCIYHGNRLGALNCLGRYEDALAMAPDIGSEYRDNTVLYQLMYACVHLERFDLAVQYGRAAVSLGGDEMDMKYLGRAYLGKRDYARAAELLKAAIWYTKKHSDGKDSYSFRGWTIEKKSVSPINESYAGIFKLLIQAYVGMGQYVEAEAACREAQELVPNKYDLSELRQTLAVQRDLIEKSGEVEKQCLRLKKELENSRNTVDECVQRMKKWSDKLVKCQMLTDEEISDELWESTVRDKMDEVLDIVCESEMASSGKFYERKLREVAKRFPKLSKPLRSYFATAEQLYANFKGNTAIDFAPVLVEYCKVVEGALWEYLMKSQDYKARCSQLLDTPRSQKTLGSACTIVSSEWDKPLYIFEWNLQKLKKLRNDSAHVGVDRVPDVEWVRTYLWQGDLLDELTRGTLPLNVIGDCYF